MDLYIEKEFLDNFYIDYNKGWVDEIVKSIITEYGNKRVFINFDLNDFEKLENENELFALISNTLPPVPVADIKTHLFEQSDFKQTLVFMNEQHNWFEEAKGKGVLCFSFDNYKKRIVNFIKDFHFEIDLLEGFPGWDFFKRFSKLNSNHIIIADNYILVDKGGLRIDDNLLPLLKIFIEDKKREIKVRVFTKELNPIKPEERYKKEKVKKVYQKLNRVFAKNKVKFSFFLSGASPDLRMHDRFIETNFCLIRSGAGFNLEPYNKSDSDINSRTIFDKSTYKKLNNLFNVQEKYIKELKSKNTNTSRFLMYP